MEIPAKDKHPSLAGLLVSYEEEQFGNTDPWLPNRVKICSNVPQSVQALTSTFKYKNIFLIISIILELLFNY